MGNEWISDFRIFTKKQWDNFDYKLEEGESLRETQIRNICTLKDILANNEGQNIVIGTHGTALSTIINYYDNSFVTAAMDEILGIMPLIVEFTFYGDSIYKINKIDVINNIYKTIKDFQIEEKAINNKHNGKDEFW